MTGRVNGARALRRLAARAQLAQESRADNPPAEWRTATARPDTGAYALWNSTNLVDRRIAR